MSDERDTRWKEILQDHRRRLQRNLSKRLDDVRANNHDGKVVEGLDAADASASDVERSFGMALAEMATQALRQVDQALERLGRGDYGLCTDCNEKISHNRLKALPFALRCRACEELREIAERARRLSARPDNSLMAYEERKLRVTRRGWE